MDRRQVNTNSTGQPVAQHSQSPSLQNHTATHTILSFSICCCFRVFFFFLLSVSPQLSFLSGVFSMHTHAYTRITHRQMTWRIDLCLCVMECFWWVGNTRAQQSDMATHYTQCGACVIVTLTLCNVFVDVWADTFAARSNAHTHTPKYVFFLIAYCWMLLLVWYDVTFACFFCSDSSSYSYSNVENRLLNFNIFFNWFLLRRIKCILFFCQF